VVVTHDQEEAMTLSTRIAVMDEGRFAQIGTPGEIYENPRNRFVADFVGNINLLEGVVEACAEGEAQVCCDEIGAPIRVRFEGELAPGARVCVALRPEKILISKEPPPGNDRPTIPGVVFDLAYFGNLSLYRVRTAGGKIVEVSAQNRRREARRYLEWDDQVHLSWDKGSALLLKE
jgi:putrescine transport system ATP-binding protein